MVDVVQQLTFKFEDLVDKTENAGHIQRAGVMPPTIEVVDALFEKMTQDPDKFADGLRKLGRKYGSVLLPKALVSEISQQATRLQELVKAAF